MGYAALLCELHAHGILRCQPYETPSIGRNTIDDFVGREAGISNPSLYVLPHASLAGWLHGLPIDQSKTRLATSPLAGVRAGGVRVVVDRCVRIVLGLLPPASSSWSYPSSHWPVCSVMAGRGGSPSLVFAPQHPSHLPARGDSVGQHRCIFLHFILGQLEPNGQDDLPSIFLHC